MKTDRKMKSEKLDFCNAWWKFFGVSMDESESQRKIVLNNLMNVYQFTAGAILVFSTFANIIMNDDRLSVDLINFILLEMFGVFSVSGMYITFAANKYSIHTLLKSIDEISDDRRNELTSAFYSRTVNIVYFLHKFLVPINFIFFYAVYLLMSLQSVIYNAYYSDKDFAYENLFHLTYLL